MLGLILLFSHFETVLGGITTNCKQRKKRDKQLMNIQTVMGLFEFKIYSLKAQQACNKLEVCPVVQQRALCLWHALLTYQ